MDADLIERLAREAGFGVEDGAMFHRWENESELRRPASQGAVE